LLFLSATYLIGYKTANSGLFLHNLENKIVVMATQVSTLILIHLTGTGSVFYRQYVLKSVPNTLSKIHKFRLCVTEFVWTKLVLYVQEVLTLYKKCFVYLHQKLGFTPFFNYIRYFWVNIIRLQSKTILGHMNSIGCCCCCLPCNHCSIWTWVVEEILAFLVVGCVLRTAGSPFIWNYADPLTSLELLNYYLTLAMSSGRFCILCHST